MMEALIAVLTVVCLASLPIWPHSRRWGWGPGVGIGIITLLVLTLLMNYVV